MSFQPTRGRATSKTMARCLQSTQSLCRKVLIAESPPPQSTHTPLQHSCGSGSETAGPSFCSETPPAREGSAGHNRAGDYWRPSPVELRQGPARPPQGSVRRAHPRTITGKPHYRTSCSGRASAKGRSRRAESSSTVPPVKRSITWVFPSMISNTAWSVYTRSTQAAPVKG
jgi:hypothetical protein